MGKYGVTDAGKDTGVSSSHAAGAHHQARDDASEGGYFSRGSGNTDKWDKPSSAHDNARETFLSVLFGSSKK